MKYVQFLRILLQTCSDASGSMQVEVDGSSPAVNGTQMIVENDSENHDSGDNGDQESPDVDKRLTPEDLSLLCDLFYLPFEHGGQGIQLLQEFNWLKSNAHLVMRKPKGDETTSQSDVCGTSYILKYIASINFNLMKILDRRMACTRSKIK